MEKQEKIFVGSAKIITTQYGDLTKVSFSEKDLNTLKDNLVNGWVNCVIKEKKNKVEGKATHYLEIDTWKPNTDNRSAPELAKANEVDVNLIEHGSELPF